MTRHRTNTWKQDVAHRHDTDRQTPRQTDRHPASQTDRQTPSQPARQTDTQPDRQTVPSQTDRHPDRHRQTDTQPDRQTEPTSYFAQSQLVLQCVGRCKWPNWISYVAFIERTSNGNSTFRNFRFSCQSTCDKQRLLSVVIPMMCKAARKSSETMFAKQNTCARKQIKSVNL